MKHRRRTQIVCYTIAIAVTAFTLFPLYWTLITSFKTYREAFAQPPQFFAIPTLKNYLEFLQQNQILLYLRNSILISVVSVLTGGMKREANRNMAKPSLPGSRERVTA